MYVAGLSIPSYRKTTTIDGNVSEGTGRLRHPLVIGSHEDEDVDVQAEETVGVILK